MATRKQLEQYAKNPNVRKFLDLIAHTEGTERNGYRTAFGGGRLNNLSDHPRYSKTFTQKNGKSNKTSAAGRYQFLRGTWDNVARQYGLNDFSAHNQDLGAVALLIGRNALGPILKGDWRTGVQRSGAEWASLPTAPASYSQPTKSWQSVSRFMGGKTSPSQPQSSWQAPSFRPAVELKQTPSFVTPEWQSSNNLKGEAAQPSFKAPEWNQPEKQEVMQQPLFKAPEWQTAGTVQPTSDSQYDGFKAPEWNPPIEQEVAQQPSFKPPEFMPAEQLSMNNNAMPELEPQEWQT